MNDTPQRRSSDISSQYDVLGVGALVVDHLAIVARYPKPDEKMAAESILLQPGGPVPSALAALSRFGRSTGFVGLVGDDFWADWLTDELLARGIEPARLARISGGKTAHAQICSEREGGTRTVIHDEGSLPALSLQYLALADTDGKISQRAQDILEGLPEAGCIHIDGREHDTMPRILEEYRRRKTLITLDCGTYRRRTLELLPLADCIIMPLEFANSIFGQRPLDRLVSDVHDACLSASRIVITDGTRGSAGWCNGEIIKQKAWSVQTIDSCGAGDIHAGAFVHAFLEEWPLADSLAFAAAAAALKCTVAGNASAPESAEAVHEFLAQAQAR